MTYTSTVRYIKDPDLFNGGKIEFTPLSTPRQQVDPESPVYARAARDFTQAEYKYPAPPVFLGTFDIAPPAYSVYALRLLISGPGSGDYVIPARVAFLKEYISSCAAYQAQFFPDYLGRFVYLTVRSGEVLSNRDDEFHVDGFQGISIPRHIPEQNYLWVSSHPTLFSLQPYFVEQLDPAKHNFHSYFEAHTDKRNLYKGVEKGVYIVDPYHVHARPKLPEGVKRTAIRLTFSPVEIRDDSNTVNPWLPRGPYNRDDIRNTLVSYDGAPTEESSGLSKT